MSDKISTLDATSFETAIKSDTPVLVDFWAEWCGPCKAIAPVLDDISKSESRFSIAKLNVDEQPSVAQKFGVMSIPTLVLFKDGEEKTRVVGAKGREALLKDLEPHLG